jgi:hypothetical protein
MSDTIVTFTSRTADEIVESGGSQAWRLKPVHARQASFLVCARNKKSDWSKGPEPHGSGFLVGRISGIVPAPKNPKRWMIQMSDWARIDVPDLWKFGRNPVHYGDIADLGIDPEALDFESVEKQAPAAGIDTPNTDDRGATPPKSSVPEAMRGLAAELGVSVDAIEITIRGSRLG